MHLISENKQQQPSAPMPHEPAGQALKVLTLSTWVRDQTVEGVEPNPGPSIIKPNPGPSDELTQAEIQILQRQMAKQDQKPALIMKDQENLLDDLTELKATVQPQIDNSGFLAHVDHAAEFSGTKGEYFAVMKYILTNSHSNRFACLANLTDIPDEPVEAFVPMSLSRPKKEKKEKDDHMEEKKKKKEKREPMAMPASQKPKLKTDEEKEIERKNVIRRIVEQFRDKKMYKLVLWLDKPMSRKFKTEVLDELWGSGWQERNKMNQYEWLSYCWANNVTKVDTQTVLLSYDIKWQQLPADTKMAILGDSRADLEAQKTHNKVMHAYNGNPLCQGFKEVEASKTFLNIAEESNSVLKPYTGLEAEKYITNIVGNMNPNQSRIFDQDRLRGNQYNANGAVVHNAVSTIPFTNLIPRTIRSDDDILEKSANRLQVTETNVTDYYVNPIEPTELSRTISDQIKNNQSSNWRRDNTSLAGFNSFDIATVNTALIARGLSTESMTLKLELLHGIMAMQVEASMINSSTYSIVDNHTIPTVTDRAVIGINDSPVFGEDCGGDLPEYPFGGETGTIAFHLTLQTVPEERRDKAIFCPPGLLQAARDGAEALALFVLSMSEWPFGIYTVTKRTTDEKGLNLADQVYVPMETVTRVGGDRVLDVVLPRRYAVANPTTQGNANALAVIRPQAGPLANGADGFAAGELLDVNFIGADGITEYPLTYYLYTWALQFDITTIRQYIGRMAALIGVKHQLWASHEIRVALCQVAPKMVVGITGSGDLPRGSAAASEVCYSSLLEVSRSEEDFPLLGQVQADFRVFETNTSTWNKVVLGLATAPNVTSEQNMHVPFVVGDPRSNAWDRLEAVPIAAAWQMYYHSRGVTTAAWNDAYTNVNNVWLQKMARDSFSTTQSTGTILPARYGKIVKNLMRNMFEREPAKVVTSVGGDEYEITHFERWLPGNRYASVFEQDETEVNLFPPTLLPDIWVQYPATHTPIMCASFPPVFGQDSTQGFGKESQLIPFRNANNNLVAPYVEAFVANQAYFPMGSGPSINDKVLWNSRLWMTSGFVQYLDYAGNAINEVVPAAGLPLGRSIPLLSGEVQPVGNTNMSTSCVPRYSVDGRRIFTYVNTAQSVPLIQACNRANRLARSAWLLLHIYIEPELQLLSDEVVDIFDQLTSKTFLDVAKSAADSAEGNIPATKELTDPQAVDSATLPSTLDPSTSMLQPAPSLSEPTTN